MGMDKNSNPMNTGTIHTALHCSGVSVGRGVKIHGGVMRKGASPKTAHHLTGIQ